MKSHVLTIGGMSCQHCVMRVTKALKEIEGVEVEDVQIGQATVRYDEHQVDENILREHIEDAGYQLLGVQ
ncbi:MAG TPA: heavy-metal-associated domain-containing protein [Bacteroidota bacterium]|nr:heavy-metal-associated domain-containing protein [Bacteroidota bacterium]